MMKESQAKTGPIGLNPAFDAVIGEQGERLTRAILPLSFIHQHARIWMTVLLSCSDLFSLFLAGLVAVGLRLLVGELINPPFYWSLVPLIAFFLIVYALRGLYPAVGLSPAEEMRRQAMRFNKERFNQEFQSYVEFKLKAFTQAG